MTETVIDSETVEETSSVVSFNNTVWIEQQRLGGNSSVRFDDVEVVEQLVDELQRWVVESSEEDTTLSADSENGIAEVDDNTENVVPLDELALGDEVTVEVDTSVSHFCDEFEGTVVDGERNVYKNRFYEDVEELVVEVEIDGRQRNVELVDRDDEDGIRFRNAVTKCFYGVVVELSAIDDSSMLESLSVGDEVEYTYGKSIDLSFVDGTSYEGEVIGCSYTEGDGFEISVEQDGGSTVTLFDDGNEIKSKPQYNGRDIVFGTIESVEVVN